MGRDAQRRRGATTARRANPAGLPVVAAPVGRISWQGVDSPPGDGPPGRAGTTRTAAAGRRPERTGPGNNAGMRPEEPNWQPLSAVPMLTALVAEQLPEIRTRRG